MENVKNIKKPNYLVEGPVSPDKIGKAVENHQAKTHCGAHALFLGQVRADIRDGKKVTAIEYSAYPEMVNKVISEIREEAFRQFDLNCLHIYHSTGIVKIGEISLMVMVSSAHRQPTFAALEWLVEQIKKRVPLWKKEFLEDGSYHWVEDQNSIKPEQI